MKSRISTTIFTALALCLLTAFASAQDKHPNLTGTWKMNAEKSKFERQGPSAITIKFDHKENSLAETLTLTNDGNDRSLDLKYTTDGKDTSQDLMGQPAQVAVKWDNGGWLIEWKADGRSFVRKLTVSADGKSITMVVTQTTPDGGTATDNVVLEKQEAK